MPAIITNLRISYFIVIKKIFSTFLTEMKQWHEILKHCKSSLIAFGHMEEGERR